MINHDEFLESMLILAELGYLKQDQDGPACNEEKVLNKIKEIGTLKLKENIYEKFKLEEDLMYLLVSVSLYTEEKIKERVEEIESGEIVDDEFVLRHAFINIFYDKDNPISKDGYCYFKPFSINKYLQYKYIN